MRNALPLIWLILLYGLNSRFLLAVENEGEVPQIKEHPLDVLVVKNDPATLRCNVSGDNVQVIWYKDNQPVNIGNSRLVLPNGSLFLLRADHDLGTYHCTATNKFGSVSSQKAHVRQATLRDEFRVRPHNVNAVLGKSVIMECSPPKGFPEPSVIWRKDDHDLPRDTDRFKIHQSGNLVIEDVQRSDSGLYTCVAWNMVGERVSGPARLFVSEKPTFLVEPKDTVAEVNSSVLFDCRVSGEPQPTVSWKKRNCVPVDEYSKCSDNMPIGRAYITDDSRGLRIDRIQAQDEGEYVCSARNGAGEIESSARLRVNSPPLIVRAPVDVMASIGQRVVFNCEAAGRPRPGVFWSKEGDPLFTFMSGHRSTDNRIEATEAGSLIINSVKATDKGIYVCAAVNSAGSALKRAVLDLEADATQSSPPPLIIYGPSAQTLLVHDIAILPCQVGGEDQPNITWFHNSEKVTQNSRISQSASGTLRISDLKKSDSGDYICQVESPLGTDLWSAHLKVEEHNNPSAVFDRMPDKASLPSAPTKPRIETNKNGAIEVEWNAPEHIGESPITHYTVRHWSAISDNPSTWTTVTDKITTTSYILSQPKSGATYFFVVRANNARGAGEPSPVAHIIYSNGSPLSSEDLSNGLKLDQHLNGNSKTVKLNSAYSINTTSALLTWTNPDSLQNDGFYLTWRGPPLSNGDSIVNITDSKSTSVIIEGLRPFSSYDFFLIPYKKQSNLSPSNSMELLTPEGKPAPPRNIFARMENLTSVMIAFSPPDANEINGVLRGFDIRFVDNSSSYENTIRTKANARSITLKNMRPGNAYQAHIAAFNGAGRSDFVSTELFTMNEATLKRHQELYGDTRRVATAPMFWLGLGGGLLALALFLLIAFVGCKRWNKQKKPLRINGSRGCQPCDDFTNYKINDGSVAVGRSEEYWPDTAIPFHVPSQNGHAGHHPMPQLSTSPRTPPHPYYSQHSTCCAAAAQNQMMMNAYGTAIRHQHYSGPYMSSNSTLNRAGDDGHQYHYAVLPNGTLPHHINNVLMAYEDDPSPYASTTVTSNGYGPPIPSNPIPPPPAMFALQHQHSHPHFAPHHCNGIVQNQSHTNSMRRHHTSSGRRTPRTNPHLFSEPPSRQVPAPAPQNNSGETELAKILSQVRPPLTYDSVTDDLSVPNYTDNADVDERQLPNRVLNSRSPPRRSGMTDESEERNLLNA